VCGVAAAGWRNKGPPPDAPHVAAPVAVSVPQLGAIVLKRSRLRELIAMICRPRCVLRGLARGKSVSSLTSRGAHRECSLR